MKEERKIVCPFCGSDEIGFVTDEIGICRKCLEKVVVEIPIEITCPFCGSKNINMVTEEVGLCVDCLEKVVVAKKGAAPSVPAPKTAEESAVPTNEIGIAVVVCPSCGSNEVELLGEEIGICKHCHSNVVINKSKPVTNVSNEVHIHTNNASPSELMSNYAVKAEIDETTFLRNALYVLGCDKETPPDIFTAEFSPVVSDHRFYSEVTCDVDLSYSATIGIDRKEEYREYDKNKNEWVTKTRTVTDWTPHSGVSKSSQSTVCSLDNKPHNGFGVTLASISQSSIIKAEVADFATPMPQVPSQSDIDEAKQDCVRYAKLHVKNNLPGDRNKDFNASGTASVTKIDNYVVPEYTMEYTYHYMSYSMHSFATQYNADWGQLVSAKKNIEEEVEHKSFKYYILTTGLLLLSIIIALTVRLYTLNIVCFAAAFASFVFTAIFRSRTRKQIYANNAMEKMRTLDKLLRQKGLGQLTESEKLAITEGKR